MGGHWGLGLKGTGYDGIIVQGASDKPVYIYIDEDGAHIEDAGDIWGKDTYETDALLKQKYGNNIVVQSIGQAGERQIKIACIMTDGKDARAGGRCGLGAVMGSKKLKAVVVKGRRKPEIHNPEALRKEVVELAKYQRENRGGCMNMALLKDLLAMSFPRFANKKTGNRELGIGSLKTNRRSNY